jgi:quercetin dioxygenase-like cupin family protein
MSILELVMDQWLINSRVMPFMLGRMSVAAILCGAVATHPRPLHSDAARQSATASHSRIVLSHSLPPMDGREIRVKVVDVTYAPGGANTSHTHPCPVIGYVLNGALRMRVNDEPEVIYRPGDTFYERAGDIHRTSANASTTAPARFLAYFMCDRDVEQLSVPMPAPKDQGARQ